MSDIINKVITIILVFVMLVIAPMVISYKTEDMMGKRQILNDVSEFIDMVKHKTKITSGDLDELYIKCNSHGLAVDVSVKRIIRTANNTFAVDMMNIGGEGQPLNTGDIIKVTVNDIGISNTRRIIYKVLKIDEGEFKFSLAGEVA